MSDIITIRKLANELSLAPVTVYRALSGHPNVRTATRRKVFKAAQSNGYLLPQWGNRSIAVIVPLFDFSGYLGYFLRCLEKEFHRRGFHLLLISKQDIDMLNDYMFIGIVSLVWNPGLEKLLPKKFAIPIIMLNAASNTLENIPQITSDPHGIRLALDYLYGRGCRKIFFVSPRIEDNPGAVDRLAEFRCFCEKTGQNFKKLHLELDWSEFEEGIQKILKTRPDACFCASETFAAELGRQLKSAGIRIPEDISLMGLEFEHANECFSPPITAIRQNFERMSEIAAESIYQAIDKKIPPACATVPFQLIERESVRNPLD